MSDHNKCLLGLFSNISKRQNHHHDSNFTCFFFSSVSTSLENRASKSNPPSESETR